MIDKLQPGAGILTEIEKDETVAKPEGVVKYIGDYSIDLIGPGATGQTPGGGVQGGRSSDLHQERTGIGIRSSPTSVHSLPGPLGRTSRGPGELSPAAPGCSPIFAPTTAAVRRKSSSILVGTDWPTEQVLGNLANRRAGSEAGPHLRAAWKYASEAIDWSPEQPAYYTGPYYLGPAHPMCVSPAEELPDVFYGQFLFMAEATDAEGLKLRPIFVTSPSGNVPVFGRFYRKMAERLGRAVEELAVAEPLVPEQYQRTFEAECSPLRWFYHTAQTQANFYESCQLRDALHAFAKRREQAETPQDDAGLEDCRVMFDRWRHSAAGRKGEYARGFASCGSGYATRLLLRNRPCLPARDRHDPSEAGSPQS